MSLLINIGFGNTVNSSKVLAVVSPLPAPSKRMITSCRDAGLLIDATSGRKTKAVIILEDGRIVLSALQPETIMRRFNAGGPQESADRQEDEEA